MCSTYVNCSVVGKYIFMQYCAHVQVSMWLVFSQSAAFKRSNEKCNDVGTFRCLQIQLVSFP